MNHNTNRRVMLAMMYCGIRRRTSLHQKLWYLSDKVCNVMPENARLSNELANFRYYVDALMDENAALLRENKQLVERRGP